MRQGKQWASWVLGGSTCLEEEVDGVGGCHPGSAGLDDSDLDIGGDHVVGRGLGSEQQY